MTLILTLSAIAAALFCGVAGFIFGFVVGLSVPVIEGDDYEDPL